MSDQLSLLDLPPTRIQDCTLRDWDVKHSATAKELFNHAPVCISLMWWTLQRAQMRGYHRVALKLRGLLNMPNTTVAERGNG